MASAVPDLPRLIESSDNRRASPAAPRRSVLLASRPSGCRGCAAYRRPARRGAPSRCCTDRAALGDAATAVARVAALPCRSRLRGRGCSRRSHRRSPPSPAGPAKPSRSGKTSEVRPWTIPQLWPLSNGLPGPVASRGAPTAEASIADHFPVRDGEALRVGVREQRGRSRSSTPAPPASRSNSAARRSGSRWAATSSSSRTGAGRCGRRQDRHGRARARAAAPSARRSSARAAGWPWPSDA